MRHGQAHTSAFERECRRWVHASRVVLFLLLTYFSATATAAAPTKAAPAANVFERYGLSPDIPKLGLSSLAQGEHLVERLTYRIETDEGVQSSQVFLVQSTDPEGNIDIRIKYDPKLLDRHEDLVSRIDSMTRQQYRLRQFAESYDRDSVVVEELGNERIVIRFRYSPYGLPQDIAYFRFMRVEVLAEAGKVQSMLITNSAPFNWEGHQVEKYRQNVALRSFPNGRVVIERKELQATGQYKGKPFKLTMTVTPVAVYVGEELVVLNQELMGTVSDPRLREKNVELHRTFPLMADLVRRQGIDLPLPFGISLAYRKQNMNVGFSDFDIMGLNVNEFFDPQRSSGTVVAESLTLRGDVNILPFWNVFGLVGRVKVDANINAQYTGKLEDILTDKLGGFGGAAACRLLASRGLDLCSASTFAVPLHLDYTVWGVGTTLSVGYKKFFASLTGTYTQTKLDNQLKWGESVVTIQPILGYQLVAYRAQVLVGAEYQGLHDRMQGNLGHIDELDRDFTYDVGVELEPWAWLVGFNKEIGNHYNITAMYNKGETREAFTINLGYRF